MKMIVIAEKRFEELLKYARNEIRLYEVRKLDECNDVPTRGIIRDMSRQANYDLCGFASKVRDE